MIDVAWDTSGAEAGAYTVAARVSDQAEVSTYGPGSRPFSLVQVAYLHKVRREE